MPPDFPPVEIPDAWFALLESFQRHGVQYVIAGSAADAIVEATPESAAALIIAPAPFRRNLEKLASALGSFGIRARGTDGATHALEPAQLVEHPAVRWRLQVAGAEVDVIGSAVGDGEFSIRLWRTRGIALTNGGRSVTAEVELVSTPSYASH